MMEMPGAGPEIEFIQCGPGMLVGLSRFDSAAEFEDVETGDGLLKFHFQAQGSDTAQHLGRQSGRFRKPRSIAIRLASVEHGRPLPPRNSEPFDQHRRIAYGSDCKAGACCDLAAL